MVAYSFNRRFVPAIVSGVKQQTIRLPRMGRSEHVAPGGTIQLYTGMRTKLCRLLGTATAQSLARVVMHLRDNRVEFHDLSAPLRQAYELDLFARGDGFSSWAEMTTWWRRTNPEVAVFDGVRIIWGSSFIRAPIGEGA